MFNIERFHLRIKPHAENVRNTRCYERSVLSMVLGSQMQDLSDPNMWCGLRGRVVPWPGNPQISCADAMSIGGMSIHVDDIVVCNEVAGCVMACLLDNDGCLLALVEEM